jgi:hypothetical protein
MGRSFAAALLFLAAAADGQELLVEYRGVVSSIERASLAENPPYSIGDAISGTLIIDTARAPADRLAGDSQIGRYYGGSPVSEFIFGTSHPAGNGSGDLVVVYDDWAPPSRGAPKEDGFVLDDRSIGTDGESHFGEFWHIVNFTVDRLSVTPRVCRAPGG